jgi:microcystin-dependent protein
MAPCVATSGNSIGHNNMMPSVVANYCICYAGVFPSSG